MIKARVKAMYPDGVPYKKYKPLIDRIRGAARPDGSDMEDVFIEFVRQQNRMRR